MKKFKREFNIIFGRDVDFFFYASSASYGMYTEQIRNYWIGIPYIVGFRYTISWGG